MTSKGRTVTVSTFTQKYCFFILSANTYKPSIIHRHYILGNRNITVRDINLTELLVYRQMKTNRI